MLFKTIMSSIRSSPILFALIAAGGLFDLLFSYLSAISYKYLIDKALLPKDASVLAILVGSLLLIGVLNVSFGIAGDYARARLGSKLLFDYRMKLFRHMQPQSQRFYERFRLGDLLARYREDIPNIQLAAIQTMSSGLTLSLSVAAGLAILFGTEWRLTLVAIAGSALLFLPYRLLKARSLKLSGAYYEQLQNFNHAINENVAGYKVVRGFNLRLAMQEKVEANLRSMLSIGVRRSFVDSNLNRLPLLAVSALSAIVLGYGSYLTFNEHLTIGTFIAYNSIFITVGQSLFGLTSLLPSILNSRTSFNRLQEVFDWKPDVAEGGTLELPPIRRALELRGVSYEYVPGQLVLKGIDLVIPASGYTCIVGASGSGKSTLLQLLLRFEEPSGGAVLYDGVDVRDTVYDSLLGQVGMVLQDSVLFNGTIRDNIRMGKPDASEREIEEAAQAAGIHDAIARFEGGYDTVVHSQGDSLSGGQRQRIALARALVRKPRVLFLDEATSALDPETEQAVSETLLSVARSRAVVSVTHRLSHAALSDRIIVLERGEVAETGSHESLLERNGPYRRMWDKQQGFIFSKGGGNARVEASRLARLPFFGGLPESALREISGLFATERFEAGERIMEQGDEGDKFYILARGKVEVAVAHPETGESKTVAVLEDGDHFGEIALLRHVPRTASIAALAPCVCLTLSGEQFHPLLRRYPAIRESLEATLQQRQSMSRSAAP
ncbi:ATP-binding cassette domain-containing protein [Cohnella thailandensis]|uniref:ATP-binding cassette domain-containing protein n=1 Tax=Cohnella thailandensis TaxID=557557 RepID=A0A841T189_9BACL|nr:ATP-binding cassette domain-containing protein [Cohnella thailandensis]MBB6634841.1 ATP-binding cassette domain-containing protein [Cohnella thailandensis]MBP1975938.1 ATP-binding cassette subfamily B protein [Cohnella thailandensis]